VLTVTKKELIKKLTEEGINIGGNPDRMLTKFVSMGLIEKPIRFGLGTGKGTTAEFTDKVVDEIKEIIRLHKEGFTYEGIKIQRMSNQKWDEFVKGLKGSSKSKEAFHEAINSIPTLSFIKKGRLKLKAEVAEVLTKVCIDELNGIFGDVYGMSRPADQQDVFDDIYDACLSCLDNVFHDLGLDNEDYVRHFLSQNEIKPLSGSQKMIMSLMGEIIEEKKADVEGGK